MCAKELKGFSARGNSWHLYMHGLPAMIGSSGRVWASGSFSFHVTCRFDFSAWPYDEQVMNLHI
ncbi:hypothetical protein ANCDUO_17176 [Ancylostoma duodenale]|uniref:Uncharacterized protein n=1 Tax=Ancylostoma duodenale TaxID=51022 RepID=A0A0C2FVX1_9BILA|nr:hypothetical protein ANCDUO_17176 [Ancylostoma duodenale]